MIFLGALFWASWREKIAAVSISRSLLRKKGRFRYRSEVLPAKDEYSSRF